MILLSCRSTACSVQSPASGGVEELGSSDSSVVLWCFKIQPYSFKTTAFNKQSKSAIYLDIQIPFPKLVCCGLRHSLLSDMIYCQHSY